MQLESIQHSTINSSARYYFLGSIVHFYVFWIPCQFYILQARMLSFCRWGHINTHILLIYRNQLQYTDT